MSNITLEQTGNTCMVFDGDELIGEIRKVKVRQYTWESFRAIGPAQRGKALTPNEALCHIGYRVKEIK